jgi:CDP-diglyceride synthetase
MNQKTKRFFVALAVSFSVALLWIIFLQATLIGVMYWYASAQMNIAILLSLAIPAVLYACFEKRKNESINNLFIFYSFVSAILILLFIPEAEERAGVGFLILPIILILSFIEKRINDSK